MSFRIILLSREFRARAPNPNLYRFIAPSLPLIKILGFTKSTRMPSAAILPAYLAIPRPSSNRSLSSCSVFFTGPDLFRPFSTASSSFTAAGDLASPPTTIRMGGGPRTYPGGVSKWQWKRMQAKKSKQLLKARLCRERQLYEMRKRAELKAAISELERPWEVAERAPVLFSASADEQVKALADRFQRPSGFDMWSERDGPRLFRSPDDLPSARFFPKGAVHSVKPYGVVASDGGEKVMKYDDWIARGAGGMRRGRRARVLPESSSVESERSVPAEEENGDAGGNRGSVVAGSRMERHEMAGSFGRRGGRYRDSYGSQSEFAVNGSSMEGDEIATVFGRRGGGDRNQSSYESHSDVAVSGSRIHRQKTGGGFDRRGNRVSYRSYSEPEKDEIAGGFSKRGGRGGNRNAMAGGFDRHGGRGGRGGSRGSYRSYSERAVGGSRMERDEIAGGFGERGGGNQSSYGSDWRKGRVEMDGGGDRDYSYGGGRVSLRPTTELRLEGGGGVRREAKWSQWRNDGFRVDRGRRSL